MSTETTGTTRYRATGKRKSAIARVIMTPGTGQISCNGRPIEEFFGRKVLVTQARTPLVVTGSEGRFDVVALLHGGGVSGQAGALRHGIAKALTVVDESLRPDLKREGFLTRDARIKERKKAGLKGARKRPQFSKR
jgi:small subunit ribosomal protein S9